MTISLAGRRRGNAGFTLVEVLILLVIIALLLAMAVPALKKIQQEKGKREKPAAEGAAAPSS